MGTAGADAPVDSPALKGRIRQSVCRWCYGDMSLDDLCDQAKAMGIQGIDLLGEGDWATAKKHGLVCPMGSQIGSIPDGWNQVENHDRLVQASEHLIPLAADAGVPSVITFSGSRRGLADPLGIDNCARGLSRITALAEKHHVQVCMELLNSKRDHHDYQCDHTTWGVELVKKVGSPQFKLLYDIYHMQIMEGDLCDTIRENITSIAHFHTGGVPGRGEIDETQEINYARVCRTIVQAGFAGYVAHEFLPRAKDRMDSLRKAVRLCDV
jgi:hydroxypyruvate isomerase